jgi:hypothetical protein
MVQRIRLADLSAVQMDDTSDIEVLGFLTWYSIGEQLISRETLREYMVESGLDEGYIPAEIRVPDAFRRATKAIECRKDTPDKGVTYNFLVREVGSNKEMVQRNIVRETVNSKESKLKYEDREAILVLDKQQGLISIGAVTEDGRRLGQQAVELFEQFKNNHDARAIRSMCLSILKSMSPTTVRSSGGVYFVPGKYETKLAAMIDFLGMLGKGEGYLVPLINTKQNLEMIRKNAVRQINETFQRLQEAGKSDELSAAEITAVLEETHLAFNIIEDYRDLLMSDLNKMDKSMFSFQKLLRTVQARKKDHKPKEQKGLRQIRLF